MRPSVLVRVVILAPLLIAALAAAQLSSSSPKITIVAPTGDTYLSGPTRLVAKVEPVSAVRTVERVTFFAGGRQVCRIVRTPFECDWDAGDRITEHQIRVVAVMRGGGALVDSVLTKGLEHAESVDVDVVQVTAVVTDDDGRFVKGLRQSDFTILEDNEPQPLTHFASENIPLEMVVALDVSSSMEGALPRVREAAKRFLTGLEPEDQVTLLAFNDNIFPLAMRTTDQAERARAIDRMLPWGGTALHDVIIKATDILGRQSGRRSIVLFSDGDDQSSHAPLEAAIARTEGSDATIYAIGQGRAVSNRELQKLMRRIADVSGGRAFFTDDPAKLAGIFQEILDDLRNQYLLAYAAPSSQRDGKWHTIKVAVGNKNYDVRARQGYKLTRQ
jgi:Ca-activated chloride channel family protein